VVPLIDAPGIIGRLEPLAQAPLQFGRVALHPPPQGDVIHGDAALGEQFLDVPVREGEAQVPADGQKNHLRFKLTPLE
jgi:hypothetical protein